MGRQPYPGHVRKLHRSGPGNFQKLRLFVGNVQARWGVVREACLFSSGLFCIRLGFYTMPKVFLGSARLFLSRRPDLIQTRKDNHRVVFSSRLRAMMRFAPLSVINNFQGIDYLTFENNDLEALRCLMMHKTRRTLEQRLWSL